MPTKKQTAAAKKNVKKAQNVWRSMTHRQRALAQPQGRARRKPGTTGEGAFYRVEVRPKSAFTSFRTQDVGEKGGLERLAGRRKSGSWDTATWLISKDKAHLDARGQLIIDDKKALSVLEQIDGPIRHVRGDIFKAHPRNVPEKDKPTLAMKRAQARNLTKAQTKRKKK
jgi:hypothetical protein